ncbi:hypothetical protein YC2023_108603 [Brassica napus]
MTRIEFTTACQDAPGVLSLDFGQPRALTHGRSAFVPYPREDGGTTICDTQADVPSARRLGAQLAFKDSMVHGILQFTPSITLFYVLHRCESQEIHCRESYAYDPTKTEVLGMDERITKESARTVRNRPTESDVSSFSGRSVSRTANHPRRRDPNTSPDHSIGRSDGRPTIAMIYPHHDEISKITRAYRPRCELVEYISVARDVCGCPSTHISARWSLDSALAVDCSGDFGTRGLSVQYTQDVHGCPSTHTVRSCVSVSTHRTSVAVRVCLCVSISTHMTFVAVHQYTYLHYTQDVRGLSTSTHRTFMVVRVYPCLCPSVHTGRPWLSNSTHISTLVLGLSTLALPVDCSGDFGQRGLSVQYTQNVRGCLPAHTGRPWLSVAVCQHTQDVRGCPCVSVSTHRTSMGVRHHTQDVCVGLLAHTGRLWLTLTLPVDCSGDFGPRGLSAQYTQDVCGCPPSHTGRLWLSMCVRQHTHDVHGFPRVSVSTHRTSVGVRQHTQDIRVCPTHISTLVLALSTLALPVDCLRDFGPRGLSVLYTQDVCGCPPAHTGRPWLSVAVRQHTQDVCGRLCVSISTHISTLVLGLSTLALPVDCSGVPCVSVSTHRTFVAVRVCPCVSVSTHRTSVAVHQYTYQHVVHTGRPWVSAITHWTSVAVHVCPSAHTGRPWLSACVRQHTQDVRGCPSAHTGHPCVSVSTHMTSVAVRVTLALPVDCLRDFGPRGLSVLYTQDVCGCPPAHTGRPWLSVAVRQHTQDVCGRLCVSISTHISTLVLGLSTLALPVDCSGVPCVSVSTHRTFVAVRVCPCVSVSTHRTSVAVHQYTYQHVVHTGRPWVSASTHRTSVPVCGCPSAHTGHQWLSVCVRLHTQDVRGCRQHTQDVRVCPSAHTGRSWLSVCVRVCPSAHTGCLWQSSSTHISMLVLGLSMLAFPVDFLGDFGPRGLSVQYTQDVRGCPPAHTGRLWLSVAVCQHTQDVCGCPCVSVSTHRTSVSVHQYTYLYAVHTGRPWVSVNTQDVRVCQSAHTGRLWLSVCVRVCPSAHTGCLWLSISTHISTLVIGLSMLPLPVDCSGDFGPRGLSVQYTQHIRGGLPAHTGHLCLSVAVRQHTQDVCGCPCVSVGVRQHTQDVRVCPSKHRTSVAVRVCPMLALPVDCLGDFALAGCLFSTHSTSVGVRQHTQDVCGCMWLSVSTHRTSVAVCVCRCVSISTHRTSVSVHQYTYQHAVHTRRLWVSVNTQDVRVYPSAHTGRPWLSVCVRVCPSAHTGRPWLSISIHISTLVLGLSTLALPVDCLGDFGQRGLSVQYTQDVRGCPPPHTGRLCLFVAVRQHTQDVRGCPCVSVSTHRTSVGVRQHTQDVCVCPSAHTGRPWLSVCVHLCPSAHTGCPWLSISTHISTLVLGLSTLALPVDCLGDFSPCGLSVQYTQDVRGCPPAHTGRPWLSVAVRQHTQDVCGCPCVSVSTHRTSVSVHHTHKTSVGVRQHTGLPCVSVSTHRTSVAVRVCPSAHTGRPWLSISTHISTLVLGLSTLTLPMDCLGDFGQRGLSVQYTQNVRGLSASTHRTSVAVRVWPCLSVCVRQHTQDVRGCPSVHISARCTHSTSVGSASTHRTSVPVCGCPSAHTGRLWLSVCVRGCPSAHTGRPCVSVKTQDVCRCPCVSVRTHMMSVAVHHTHSTSVGVRQHTQDVCGCMWLSVSTHMTSVAVCVCRCVSVSTHRTSVSVHQYTYQHAVHTRRLWVSVNTQDVRVYPSAHTGRPWLSVCVRVCPSAHTGRPWLSISIHISTLVLGLSTLALPVDCLGDFGQRGLSFQYTQDVRGCPPPHTGRLCLFVAVRQHTQDVRGCPCVSVSTHRTSVGVRQHTQDVRVCPSEHTGRPWLSVCVRLCPSAHTGCPWLSISTHISTLVLGLSTLALPVDCLGDFSPCGLSVQYTQDVRGCPPAHTGRPWLSVAVRQHTQDVCGCLCVSVSTHRTSVSVHQYTYQHAVHTGRLWVSVITQDFRVCPSAHTGRPWLSVCVRQHTQDVRGCPSVHISARWSLDSAHTGRPWLSLCVRVCPSAHRGRPWLSISTHISTLVLRLSTLTLHVDCSGDFSPRGLSVQYKQDVCGCPPAHTGRPWLSVCVRVCPSAHTGRPWLSISTHISTLVLGLSTLALPVDCLGDFWPTWAVCSIHTGRPWLSQAVNQHTQDVRGFPCVSVSTHRTSVGGRQHTQDVRVCPSAHTGRSWLSVCVHQHTQDVRGCPSVHISARCTHRMSVGVRQHTQDVRGCLCVSVCVRVCPSAHPGRPWLTISTHISTLVLGLSTLALPVDCSGDFGPRGLSVHYTQNVRGCPSAHPRRPWVSVSTHRTSVTVRVCPCVSVSTHRMSVAVNQHTYQHVGSWTQHADPSRGLFGTSVCVQSAHTGCPWLSVCVRLCPSAQTGCLWLSISTHISTLVLGLSTLTLPVDCSGEFGPRGLSVQYTQDVRGCSSAHTGRPWLSVCVRVCPSVSGSTLRITVAVHRYTYQHVVHTGCPWVSASRHRMSVAVCGCPSAHTGRPWLSMCVRVCPSAYTGRQWVSVSTHRTAECVCQHTHDVRVCPCVSNSTHRTSVAVHQYTYQHSVYTGRPWVSASTHRTSVAVRVCPCVSVCVRQHTQDVHGCPLVHISARWSLDSERWPFSWTVWVIFGPRGLSVQYTEDVRGCPPAHTGRRWLSVSTHRTFVAVRVCPCVSVSTHRTSVGVRQHTHDVRVCLSAHIGRPWLSVCVHQHTQDVRRLHTGRPWVSASTHRTSVSVRGCPCMSVCVRLTHRTCVSVHQYTYQHLVQKRRPRVSASKHRTSVTVRGCPSAHTGRLWLSVCVRVCPTHRTSVAVRVCPSKHTGRLWLSISTHISTLVLGLSTLALPVVYLGDFGPRGLSFEYTQDVRGCPPAHTGHAWLSVSTYRTSMAVRVCPCVSVRTHNISVAVHQHTYNHTSPWTQHAGPSRGLFGAFVLGLSTLTLPVDSLGDFVPRGLSVQYTQDVCGCPSAHTGPPCVSVSTHRMCVAVSVCPCCPSAHTGRLWLSISTHISTLVLGLSTLTLPVDCSGDFGPRGLSVQYTQDVCGVRQHTPDVCGCPCVSVSIHRTSYTQDVRGCPPAHTRHPWLSNSTHRTFMAVHVCLCVSVSTHKTSVGVRQHTHDVCVCLSAHTGRPWLSVCVRQHTQNVRGCPSVHISARWFLDSARSPFPWTVRVILAHVGCLLSTHRTSVGFRQHKQDVRVCLWVSVYVRLCPSDTQDVRGCPSVHISARCTHRTSVAGHQYTYQHAGPSRGLFGTSVAVRVCPCVSVSTHRTSVAVHHTHRTSVGVHQHTQDLRVCPSAHTGCLWLSVCVHVCPSARTGRLWLSISSHISALVLGLSTLTLPVDCLGDFGPRGLSVQYTQDVRGCPSAHTGPPCVSVSTHRISVAGRVCPCMSVSTHRMSVAVHHTHKTSVVSARTHQTSVAVRVCPSADTGRPWLSISTHISMLILGISTLALLVDCLGDFWPKWAVCSVYTGRPWVSASTHRTSVALRQHTQDVHGCLTSVAVRVCPSAHTGRPSLSISTHISTLVLGLSTLTLPVDCSGDFGPCGLSVEYTQDVRGTSVAVHQYTYQHVVHTRRPWVSASTHRTSVAVRGCPSAHTGRMWLSVCVRQHTQDVRGCPPVHISACWSLESARWPFLWTVWVIFGPRGLSVQYTQDVRGCPPAHTGRPWLSDSTHRTFMAVRVCLCVFVSTHKTSVGVRQHTHDVCVCLSAHTGRPWLSVCVRQHTQDVRGCPSVHISARCTHKTSVVSASTHQTSVAVRVCPSAYTGRPWLSISTHISMLVLGISTLALLVDCLGDFGPTWAVCSVHTGRPWVSASTHKTSMAVQQYTQDVHGCPCVSVCVRQHTQDVRGCPTHRTSVAVHQYTYQHDGFWTQHAHPSRGLFGTSVAVHQYTYQHVGPWTQHAGPTRGLFGTHRTSVAGYQYTYQHAGPSRGLFGTSVAVRVCPCVSVSTHRTSVAVHQYTYSALDLGLRTLTLPVDCLGDFGPRGLSVQYTQDVRGCPSAHTGPPCVSVSTHRMSVALRVCPCVPISTHRTSVAVHQFTYQRIGPWTQYADPSRGLFGTSVCVRQHTQDVRGCPSVQISARCTHKTSVVSARTHQTSVAVRVCPSADTGRPWLSISTHISMLILGISTLALLVDCLGRQWLSISTHISTVVLGLSTLALPVDFLGDFGPRGLSVQYTQDVRGCPPAHTGRPWLSVAVRQHTQDVCGCPCVSVSTHMTSVGVCQHIQDVCVCPSEHIGRLWLSMCVRVCPSAHTGHLWLSISTHISMLVLGISTLALPVNSLGDFWPTWAVCSVHTGRPWVSARTHKTSVAVRQHTQDVHGCPCVSVCVSVCLSVSVSTHKTSCVY